MVNADENSARREFLAYRQPLSNSLYALSVRTQDDIDADFFETVEVMGNSKEFYLQSRSSLMNE